MGYTGMHVSIADLNIIAVFESIGNNIEYGFEKKFWKMLNRNFLNFQKFITDEKIIAKFQAIVLSMISNSTCTWCQKAAYKSHEASCSTELW